MHLVEKVMKSLTCRLFICSIYIFFDSVNWHVRARFNKAEQKKKAVPSDDELLRNLVNSLSMEYIGK